MLLLLLLLLVLVLLLLLLLDDGECGVNSVKSKFSLRVDRRSRFDVRADRLTAAVDQVVLSRLADDRQGSSHHVVVVQWGVVLEVVDIGEVQVGHIQCR